MEKLIRDKIVDIALSSGETLKTRISNGGELTQFLKNKIVEEANEVFLSGTKEEITEELADLLTVIKAFGDHLGIEDNIFEAAEKKYEERGGFEKGIILIKENI